MTQEPTPKGPGWIHSVVIALLALWMSSHLLPPINLDVGCLLYAAKRWLAGDRLYVDVIDPNTPWAIALHVPAEFMARYVGLDGPTWFSAFVVGAIGLSTGLASKLARRHPEPFGPLVATTLPLVALFVLGVDAGRCFGQREHLLMIAAIPYLTLSVLRIEGRKVEVFVSIIVAVIAGFGFTIKPHFLLPFALVELAVLTTRGLKASLRDVVPWAILAVQGLHALFAFLVTPAYIEVIIPLVSEVYASPAHMGLKALQVLFGPELAPVTLLLPILGALSIVTRFALGRLFVPFIVGAAAMSAIQGKGWTSRFMISLRKKVR